MTAEDTLAAGLEEYRRARIRRACLLLWGLSGCLLPLVAFASLRLGKAIPALVCLVTGVAITLVCHRIVRDGASGVGSRTVAAEDRCTPGSSEAPAAAELTGASRASHCRLARGGRLACLGPMPDFTAEELVADGMLPSSVLEASLECIRERRNILVIGPTGTGKTTLLAALAHLSADAAPTQTASKEKNSLVVSRLPFWP